MNREKKKKRQKGATEIWKRGRQKGLRLQRRSKMKRERLIEATQSIRLRKDW